MADYNRYGDFPSKSEEVASLAKKYGELTPKKRLISKDHERAYFDSADWALGKQEAGKTQNPWTVIESLRPKLQRTPHQQLPLRRPKCSLGQDNMVD